MTCHHCRKALDLNVSTFEDRAPNGHRRYWCSLECIYHHQNPLQKEVTS